MTTTTTLTSTPTALTTGATRLTAKTSVTVRDTVSHSLTLAYRGILKIRHNPEQLFDVTFQPIIFTLMFTYLFGGAVSGNVSSYLPIIIPGILVQTVITASVVTGTQLREDMDKGVFDRFRSLPIARISPLAGALLADVVRYLVAVSLTMIMGVILGWRPELWGAIVSAVLVMVCAFSVSWIFALLGCLMSKASSVQGLSMLVMFPLTFMSNAFVPVDTLPGWLQAVAKANPVSQLVSAVRDLTNNGHIGAHLVWTLVGAAIVTAIFAPLAVRAYMRNA